MLRLAKKGVANHHPFGANFICMTFELTRKIVGAAELSGKGGPVLGRPTFPLIASAKQDNESGSLQFVNRNPKMDNYCPNCLEKSIFFCNFTPKCMECVPALGLPRNKFDM